MSGFLQGLGLAYGRQLQYNDQKQLLDADIALKQQAVQQGQLAMDTQKQQAQIRQQISQQIADEQRATAATVTDPMQQAKQWRAHEAQYNAASDWEGAARAGKMADELVTQSKEAFAEGQKAEKEKKDTAATAAQDLLDVARDPSATPASRQAAATAFGKAALATGIDPTKLPLPNTAEFASLAKRMSLGAQSAEKRQENAEKTREFEQRQKELRESKAASLAERMESRRLTAAIQQGNLELRRSEAVDRHARTNDALAFRETEHLNSTLQSAARPLLGDRDRITSVKGMLSVNSSEGDQQVHQALTSLLGNFKGRATNLYYKDNKNFGDTVDKLFGWASHTFVGRYDEKSRHDIYQMLDHMEKTVVDPALTRLESDQQRKAKKFNLDPADVAIQGDFNRVGSAAPAAPTPSRPADVQKIFDKYKGGK